jgi:hypothetical protein
MFVPPTCKVISSSPPRSLSVAFTLLSFLSAELPWSDGLKKVYEWRICSWTNNLPELCKQGFARMDLLPNEQNFDLDKNFITA